MLAFSAIPIRDRYRMSACKAAPISDSRNIEWITLAQRASGGSLVGFSNLPITS
jgi:hypothetical protein